MGGRWVLDAVVRSTPSRRRVSTAAATAATATTAKTMTSTITGRTLDTATSAHADAGFAREWRS